MAINSGKTFKFKLSYLFAGIFLIALIGGGVFGYQQYSELKAENKRLSNPQEAAKTEVEKTKSQVSALIEVPKDEEPTVANVADVTKLSDQEFFKNAKNGDKLLVYQKAKRAILYRPDTNKIIEVSTINIGDEKKAETPKTGSEQKPEVSGAATTNVEATQPGLSQ